MAKAYVIGTLDVHDMDHYGTYTRHTPGIIAKFGGKFIVRGGKFESLEGEAPKSRNVVIEFPSYEQAKAFYTSEEYGKIIGIRHTATTGNFFLIEGLD